jgi:hypothetical protein
LAAVWVALRERRSVVLTVFEGRQQAGTGTGVFTGGQPRARGAVNSLRLGEALHVAVAVAELPPPAQALTPGLNYSYNVGLGAFDGNADQAAVLDPASVTPTADLRSEKLLGNDPIDGRPHKALGYDEGELPGFALPPPALTDLRILHGSCRRPGFSYPDDFAGVKSFDALAWVDDLILEWRRGTTESLAFDANVRPHQLFFTGDQIYADDVSSVMLPMLNRVGNQLIGSPELLPTKYPPADTDAAREAYVGAPKQSGFDTLQKFVDAARAAGRDPLAELKEDRRVRVLQDPCFSRAFQMVYPATGYDVDPSLALDTDQRGLRHWESTLLNFPAALRAPLLECEAQFSTTDNENHLISFGEFCAMYLSVWSNAVWQLDGDAKPALATIDDVYRTLPVQLPQLWDLHACFPDRDERIPRTDAAALEEYLKGKRDDEKLQRGFKRALGNHAVFYESLPRVRRALANVPTYMVFDDHDVTDDWNLSRAWRDRVFTSPLGRRIVMSALVAYVAFQDWGNDPLRYRQAPFKELLDHAREYQPVVSLIQPNDTTPQAVAHTRLQQVFGFNQPDPEQRPPQPDPANPPPLKWHFSIDGPRHRVVALDLRTRRAFPSRYLPPGLLAAKALEDQLPPVSEHPLPAGVDVLVVISQTPVVLPSIATRLIIPVKTRLDELDHHASYRRLVGLEPDNEIWPGDVLSYETFLRRLTEYRKVVVLSGEVHYGSSGELTYWRKGLKRLTLDPSLEADLSTTQQPPVASARLRQAFDQAGFALGASTGVQARAGNDEWIVADFQTEQMFLVRKENDGLNVYEEELPARVAQFVSSGLKNVKGDIFNLGRLLGFAFPLVDLTPAERLVWDDNTPVPVRPPPDGRFPLAVSDRFGSEPVSVPSGNWPPGTTLLSRPDSSWRADAVQDERPDDDRPDFTKPPPLPDFDPNDVAATYGDIADAHAKLLDTFRFNRGVLYQSNVGLIRFELEEDRIVARQDLVSHPPGRHEGVPVTSYRIPLEVFGLERPKLSFDLSTQG